jgi:hypothetical protein
MEVGVFCITKKGWLVGVWRLRLVLVYIALRKAKGVWLCVCVRECEFAVRSPFAYNTPMVGHVTVIYTHTGRAALF